MPPLECRLITVSWLPCALHVVVKLTSVANISEFWYSLIIRSLESIEGSIDPSKRVLNWARFCVWAGQDTTSRTTTIVALKCPEDLKAELVLALGDKGEAIKQHPMLIHAFLAQNILLKTDKFLENFADPIYNWVRTPTFA